MAPKKDWEKYEKKGDDADKKEAIVPLDEGDIQLLRTYGQGPYASALKRIDQEIKDAEKRVNEKWASRRAIPAWPHRTCGTLPQISSA